MSRRNLSSELTLLATEVDSLQKRQARAEAELATEREHRTKAEVERDDLRQQLTLMRQRAKTAERELAKLADQIEREHHEAEMVNRELHSRLEEAGMSREQLEEALERKQREAAALEQNIHELMETCGSRGGGRTRLREAKLGRQDPESANRPPRAQPRRASTLWCRDGAHRGRPTQAGTRGSAWTRTPHPSTDRELRRPIRASTPSRSPRREAPNAGRRCQATR